jgi:hypothetical protein
MKPSLLALAAVTAVAVAASSAGAQSADERAIRDAIERHYFAAHASGKGDPLKGWFVPDGRMMSVQNGQLRVVPSETYIGGFGGTPAADEAQRRRRVVMVDVAGDAAIAKVELDYPAARFVDYFQLLKVDGEWKLVNKIFNRQPKTR